MHDLAISKPLLLDTGAEPGPQEGRVEGLRKVVLGPQLDAAHGAFHFVERGDHDDGHVAQRRVGLHLPEHLVAVHVRHHDVQKDRVERPLAQDRERLLSGGRDFDLGALRADSARQHVPVRLVVVDDEDPAVERGQRPRVGGDEALEGLELRGRFCAVRIAGRVRLAGDEGEGGLEHPRQLLPRSVDPPEVARQLVVAPVLGVLEEHLRVTNDVVEGRPELVSEMGAQRLGVDGAGFQRLRAERLVDHGQEPPRGGQDPLDIGAYFRGGRPRGVVEQELGALHHDPDLLPELQAQGGQPDPQRLVALSGQRASGGSGMGIDSGDSRAILPCAPSPYNTRSVSG